MRNVIVTHEVDGVVGNLAQFETVADAVAFIAAREAINPDGVRDGAYGVDAPEEKLI